MSDDLRVTTAHLRELSARQGQASAQLNAATAAVGGVDTSVRWSHGSISWATAAAVEAAQNARRSAGLSMAGVSDELSRKLTSAANRYDHTDQDGAESVAQWARARLPEAQR